MARLRVRMELNRGGVGVPLEKLVHVVDEAHKFFKMLGDDVHLSKDGEWLGFDFDNQSLNFTAEYVGPVDAAQVREFHAAFDGVTLLRRATIAQFAHIADPIEEDELIGFGLFLNDHEPEPSEWRSLSKREALRITEEIRLLLDRTGDNAAASRIPAALDPNGAASLFKERREHTNGERRLEALFDRVDRLENEVGNHSETIASLQGATTNTEQNLQKLLVTVDAFCDRATKQIERLPAIEAPEPPPPPSRRWRIPVPVIVVAVLAMIGFLAFRSAIAPTGAVSHAQTEAVPKKEASQVSTPEAASTPNSAPETPAPAADHPSPAAPASPPAVKTPEPAPSAQNGLQRVEVKAIEPTWTAIYVDGKSTFGELLDANQTKVVESPGTIRVRVGNAGGVEISLNGKSIGPAGRAGQVRTIEFAKGEANFSAGESK